MTELRPWGYLRRTLLCSGPIVLLAALVLIPGVAIGDSSALEESLKLLERSQLKALALTLTIGAVSGEVGQPVQVPVTLVSEEEGPTTVILLIEFDETKLSFVSATLGEAVPGGKVMEAHVVVDGVWLIVYGLDLEQNAIADGAVFRVNFDVLDSTPMNVIPLTGLNASAAAIEAVGSTVTVVGFTVTVEDGQIDLDCPAVDAPTNVQATDGDAGGVTVTWDAGAGADEYRVFRSATNSTGTSVPLGGDWQAATSFFDDTATLPTPPQNAGCSGGGEPTPNTFYYWIKGRARLGCESSFSVSDTGYRGEDGGKVFEEALPSVSGGGLRVVDPRGALFIRLQAPEGIDPSTVWAGIVDVSGTPAAVSWRSLAGDNSDGWVVCEPEGAWLSGDVITVTAGAETVTSRVLEPVTVAFVVASRENAKNGYLDQPGYEAFDGSGIEAGSESMEEVTVSLAGDGVPALAGGVGAAYELGPQDAFAVPQRVWLPVPEGIDAGSVTPHYLFADDGIPQWRGGEDVEGWLVPGSGLLVQLDGVSYYGFAVRHAGLVRLGFSLEGAPVAFGASLRPGGGDLLLLLSALAVLAAMGPVVARRRARR